MTLSWRRDDPPLWDADKQRVIGGAPEGTFDLPFADGELLPGEWWAVRDDELGDRIVAYGRLDISWGGDAEILLAVEPERQNTGVGSHTLSCLEAEAERRGVNYIYNTIREHEGRELVHDWLVVRGFRGLVDGDLRKRVGSTVPAGAPASPRPSVPYDLSRDPGGRGPGHEEKGGYVSIEDHRF